MGALARAYTFAAVNLGDIDIDNRLKLLERAHGMGKVITPHFERLIDRFVASGRFNNKSEVIRAGLRLLEEHETEAATI